MALDQVHQHLLVAQGQRQQVLAQLVKQFITPVRVVAVDSAVLATACLEQTVALDCKAVAVVVVAARYRGAQQRRATAATAATALCLLWSTSND